MGEGEYIKEKINQQGIKISRWHLASSFHPYGVPFRYADFCYHNYTLAGLHPGALIRAIIMPPLRGCCWVTLICAIVMPPLRGCICTARIFAIIMPPLRGCIPVRGFRLSSCHPSGVGLLSDHLGYLLATLMGLTLS